MPAYLWPVSCAVRRASDQFCPPVAGSALRCNPHCPDTRVRTHDRTGNAKAEFFGNCSKSVTLDVATLKRLVHYVNSGVLSASPFLWSLDKLKGTPRSILPQQPEQPHRSGTKRLRPSSAGVRVESPHDTRPRMAAVSQTPRLPDAAHARGAGWRVCALGLRRLEREVIFST